MAAFVGLLASLTVGVSAAPALAPVARAATQAVVALGDGAALSTPATGTVSDAVRSSHPAAVRAGAPERPAVPHTGGWALTALLLLLAAVLLAVGVRRTTSLVLAGTWRHAVAPRAPPLPVSC